MSTRANIIIKDERSTLYFYRHSDGYPECAGKDLAEFVKGYANEGGTMRADLGQSAGWLIVRGHAEYLKDLNKDASFTGHAVAGGGYGWKVGAYEPTTELHGDVEYIYIVDLVARTLTCRVPNKKFWDAPKLSNTTASKEFGPVSFDPEPERSEEDVVEALASEVTSLYHALGEGFNIGISEATERVLKAADVGPERETRRAFDGVSEASFMVQKMIGEMLINGKVNL